MRYVIIGNGVAGMDAAVNIRKNDPHGDITIISQSNNLTYYRPRLIDYLAGKVPFEKILVKPMSFYEENSINLALGEEVVSIDSKNQEIVLESGKTMAYDKLLLATGARCFVPPVKGSDKDNVLTFRNKTDTDEIHKICDGAKKFVVIGGGLLGLETANSLKNLGVEDVTVIEFFDRLLPRQLDTAGAAILQKQLEEKGLKFLLGKETSEITGEGKDLKVVLKSGETIDTNGVVFSTGIRPRLELAKTAGVETNKAVIVNDHLETSVKNIYAAGDLVEHNGICYGLWLPAKDQARTAALNMTGSEAVYEGTPFEARLKITGISLFSAGDFNAEDCEVKVAANDTHYKKFVVKDGKLVGVIILGDNSAAIKAAKIFEGKSDIGGIDGLL